MKVIKFAPGLIPVLKHQEHDQSSHGSWADSGSPKLTILGKNDGTNEFFNEKTRVVRYQPEGKEPKDYVLFADEDFVVAFVKPTDGTTINGYSAWKKNKGEIGHLDVTGAGSNPWRSSAKDDNKATIVEVVVGKAHQRRGLASAMLRFHRDMFPELDVQHSDAQLPDGKAWADVAKHQEHDQSSHGNWATGTPQGGNGLGHREIYQLQSGTSDSLMRRIYDAEERFQPNVQREFLSHFLQAVLSQTSAEYDKAYKAYSKAFDEWSRASTKNIKINHR
jgi:ribosomal protein S18 acetylase RimI-like enzyme